MRCFEAGFRKHPKYYRLNDYESLNHDDWHIFILLEKLPGSVLDKYPLSLIEDSSALHMDMLRRVGERSDAHVIRYHWASDYIKPGDKVLDAACGLGYGSWVIRNLSYANEVVGLDDSAYAIDYAFRSFTDEALKFSQGRLPEVLATFPDNHFDAIVSFETLEHVEFPKRVLAEFHRILTPGGRIFVSVPNDWSDDSGKDPNPHHLHVYDWQKIKSQLAKHFVLEHAFALTATQCKSIEMDNVWEPRQRSLKPLEIMSEQPPECEWLLMSGMKNPSKNNAISYREKCFSNVVQEGRSIANYASNFSNPWIMHSLVNIGYRLKNKNSLRNLCNDTLTDSDEDSNDYAAALCVMSYIALNDSERDAETRKKLISRIDETVSVAPNTPEALRWQVSLSFVKGRLLQSVGDLEGALAALVQCSRFDVREYSIHLATKPTEALYLAGKIAYALGRPDEAKAHWQAGIGYGEKLLSVSLDDVLLNPEFPNRFHHGDGVKEYSLAWDNIARCANGLHALNRKKGFTLDNTDIDICFHTEAQIIQRDLRSCRADLISRTEALRDCSTDLISRTEALDDCRNKTLLVIVKEKIKRRFR